MTMHLLRMAGIIAFIALGMVYPFLPGRYDSLAMPLSTVAQAGAVVALLLVPIGVLWLLWELKQLRSQQDHPNYQRRYYFALAATITFLIVALIVSLVAFAAAGISLALITIVLWLFLFPKILSKLKASRNSGDDSFWPAPLYLVLVPFTLFVLQLTLAAPLTDFSRNRAMSNSSDFIGDIEAYHAQYGRYPTSLLAMWKDYDPYVVGVEKYHYAPGDNAYDLFFEQPRFLLDNIGTREWVVYNPGDEHRMFSHTAWFLLLTPEQLERSQGWYAVHELPQPHWRSFWFD